jgi:EcsC protein family
MDSDAAPPSLLPPDLRIEIAELALRHRRANGPVMALVNRLGGTLETQLALIPEPVRARIEAVVADALATSYGLAGRAPEFGGEQGPLMAAMASGAAGGAGGIVTSVAELPVTITLILRAIRMAARETGFDPDAPNIRAECLKVFASGGPLGADDAINTSFLSARLTITGPALQKIIATVAPKLAAAMGQKLAAQAVPVLGAVTGAALNAAFLRYYREVARIRFALLRLAETHGAEAVLDQFVAAASALPIRKA